MKYLGIDYGTKRIGIAVSDDNGKIAFPKGIIENDYKFLENLKETIRENSIKTVVIGESKNFKMEDNEIMDEIIDLKKVLEAELDIDVVFNPEFLTSVEATKITGKKEGIDDSAAAIILQDYMDKQNRNEENVIK